MKNAQAQAELICCFDSLRGHARFLHRSVSFMWLEGVLASAGGETET